MSDGKKTPSGEVFLPEARELRDNYQFRSLENNVNFHLKSILVEYAAAAASTDIRGSEKLRGQFDGV